MDIKKIKFKDIQYALGKGKNLHYIPNLIDKAMGKEKRTYTIEGTLGQGGFGITYLASSTFKIGNVPQKVYFAVKEFFVKGQCWREAGGEQMMLPKAKSAQNDVSKWLEEFVDEAEKLNRICKDMPHIVNVNEVFRANGTAYYVMEFLDGGSLKDMIVSQSGLSEQEALSIILPIARTIADLHKDHHIIHCDIKDDNIMMRKNEDDGTLFPVLIDFGESRHFNTDGSLTSKRSNFGGTAGYFPLEQTAGDITVQVDVYALAATLFCALTGNPPQVASSVTSDYIKDKLPEDTSSSVKEAIIHAMQTNKYNRTATMADFVQEVMNGIIPPTKPDELPIGYVLNGLAAYYRIASQGIKHAGYIQYKALRLTKKDSIGPVRAPKVDVYEFFVDGCHHRNDDMSVSFDSDTSVAWQQYLKLCSEKTGNNTVHEFQTSKGEGWATSEPLGGTKKKKINEDKAWATFEANNTYYLVWNKIRKPLPWRKIVTYSAIGIGSLLLVWGIVSIIQGINAAKERERQEMSRRLTEAIASNDYDVLREFAVDHDSTRAYLPYAKFCLDNNDFSTARKFAEKAMGDSISSRILAEIKKNESKSNSQDKSQEEEAINPKHVEEPTTPQTKDENTATKEDAQEATYQKYLAQARQLYEKKKYDDALTCLNQVPSQFSKRNEVVTLKAQINTAKKRIDAEKDLYRAREAMKSQNYDAADRYAKRALKAGVYEAKGILDTLNILDY